LFIYDGSSLKAEILLSLFDEDDLNFEEITEFLIDQCILDQTVLILAIQKYFLKLSEPLIPKKVFEELLSLSNEEDEDYKLVRTKMNLNLLSETRYKTFQFITFFFIKMLTNSEKNGLNISIITEVFSPCLLRPENGNIFKNNLIEDIEKTYVFIIENYYFLFQKVNKKK
jgi:hypothetical protein